MERRKIKPGSYILIAFLLVLLLISFLLPSSLASSFINKGAGRGLARKAMTVVEPVYHDYPAELLELVEGNISRGKAVKRSVRLAIQRSIYGFLSGNWEKAHYEMDEVRDISDEILKLLSQQLDDQYKLKADFKKALDEEVGKGLSAFSAHINASINAAADYRPAFIVYYFLTKGLVRLALILVLSFLLYFVIQREGRYMSLMPLGFSFLAAAILLALFDWLLVKAFPLFSQQVYEQDMSFDGQLFSSAFWGLGCLGLSFIAVFKTHQDEALAELEGNDQLEEDPS